MLHLHVLFIAPRHAYAYMQYRLMFPVDHVNHSAALTCRPLQAGSKLTQKALLGSGRARGLGILDHLVAVLHYKLFLHC